MSTLSEQVRERLRDEMHKKEISQRELADLLKWSQSRIMRAMTGRSEIGIDDLQSICFALGLSVLEVVRDQGLDFCAEMTPTEVRLLEKFRALDQVSRDAYLHFLNARATSTPDRYALKPHTKRKRNVG